MKLKYLLPIFLTISLIFSFLTVTLVLKLNKSIEKAHKVQKHHFNSIILSKELQKSSNELTQFARLFVQTGNVKYKQYFYNVLDIRKGKVPTPKSYGGIYWDLILSGDKKVLIPKNKKSFSLKNKMKKLKFTKKEFLLLEKAEKISNNLAKIETQAFYALQGRFIDKKGKYTIKSSPNFSLARKLLHSHNYFAIKSLIMKPINQFQNLVSNRTLAEIKQVQKTTRSILILLFFVTAILFGTLVIFAIIIWKKIIIRINILSTTAIEVNKGNLSSRSQIFGKDELGILGHSFDTMLSKLSDTLKIVTTSKQRMEDELNIAKEIQMSMVPRSFPAYPENHKFDMFAKLVPAKEVGGDFYDFYFIDSDHLCITVGDVSGKGVPAALMMAVCRSLLKNEAQDNFSTASVLTHVNHYMSKENPHCMFVTVFMGILNTKTGRMIYTNAGHNPVLIKNKDAKVTEIAEQHGPVVAAIEDVTYKESFLTLNAGDSLLAYTDGITEAHNTKKELYSEERLITFMEKHNLNSATSFVNDLYADVQKFETGNEPFDDITALCLRYLYTS